MVKDESFNNPIYLRWDFYVSYFILFINLVEDHDFWLLVKRLSGLLMMSDHQITSEPLRRS